MATSYPGGIDGQPSNHGDVSDAVLAVEGELGVNPSGSAATVRARLDAADAATAANTSKLTGIANGATANATDTQLRDRSTHTGTQTSATISDFTEAVQDAVAAVLTQGTNVTLTYDDAANSLTIAAAGGGGGLDAEAVRDAIGVALIGIGVISVTINDAADTITISSTATANSTDAALRDRSTHTGTQAISTVSGLQAALDSIIPVPTGGTTGQVLAKASNASGDLKWADAGAVSGTTADFNDTGYDIVLLMGQSNMQGDSGGATSSIIDVTNPKVYTYNMTGSNVNTIALANDPLGHNLSGGAIVGPGMSFARWYEGCIPGNRRVLLVPTAYNGSGLITGSPQWTAGTGGLYSDAVAQALAAKTAAGANARFAAALWIQGETDAIASISGSSYQTALLALIGNLRTALSTPNLPFVIGSMTPEFMASYSAPTKAAIDAAHKAIPGLLTYTAFVQGPSGMGRGDNLHYSPAGHREMGRRLVGGVAAALANGTPTAPAQVTGLSGDAGNTQVVLTWSAPSNGGSAITDYTIQWRTTAGPGSWNTFSHTPGTATTRAVTGLTNGTSYDFRVAAVNAIGTGSYSSTVSATPSTATAPGQVTALIPTPGNTQVALTWTAPSTGGSAITDYVVQYRTTAGPGAWNTFSDGTSTATAATVTGLTNGTSYDFQVAAVNAIGQGTYSSPATSSPTAPAATYADTFTRANSTTSMGTTETGSLAWTAVNGTWGINTNQAYSVGGANNALVGVNVGSANGTIEGTTATRDAGTALVWRMTDSANWYCLLISAGLTQFCKSVSGTVTTLGSAGTSANGDVWKVVVNGTTFNAYRNGATTPTLTATDSSLSAAGTWGFRADTTGGRFDNFNYYAP